MIHSTEFLNRNRFNFLLFLRINVGIGHFQRSTNTLTIVFNKNIWHKSFSNIFILLTLFSKKEFSLRKFVFEKKGMYDFNFFKILSRCKISDFSTLFFPSVQFLYNISNRNIRDKIINRSFFVFHLLYSFFPGSSHSSHVHENGSFCKNENFHSLNSLLHCSTKSPTQPPQESRTRAIGQKKHILQNHFAYSKQLWSQ